MLSYIQVLRAIAVIAVIIFHLDSDYLPGGYLGVDVFFVVSGFVITRSIYASLRENRFNIREFFIRRIWRLLPALIVLISSVLVATILFSTQDEFNSTLEAMPWALMQISNVYFPQEEGYFDAGNELNPLLHTWSLGLEEQFYLFFPFFLSFIYTTLQKKDTVKTISILTSIATVSFLGHYVLATYYNASDWAFFILPTRIWQFLIGASAAILIVNRIRIPAKIIDNRLIITSILLIVSGCFLYLDESSTLNNPSLLLVPSISTALLTLLCSINLFTKRIWKPLIAIGNASYSLYLWHWPVICLSRSVFGIYSSQLVEIAASVILAILSYRIIEMPIRQLGKQIAHKNHGVSPIRKWAPAYCNLFLLPIVFVISNNLENSSWRLNDHVREATIAEKEARQQTFTDHKIGSLDLDAHFSSSSPYDVLLIGDSHAIAAYPAIKEACNEVGLSLGTFIASSYYPLAPRKLHFIQPNEETAITIDQSSYQRHMELSITSNDSLRFIILIMRTNAYIGHALQSDKYTHQDFTGLIRKPNMAIAENQETYRSDLTRFLDILREHKKQIIVLTQVPPLMTAPSSADTPTKFASALHSFLLHSSPNTPGQIPFVDDFNKRLQHELTTLLELTNEFRFSIVNSSSIIQNSHKNGRSLYRDDDHINLHGARLLKPAITDQLRPKLNTQK